MEMNKKRPKLLAVIIILTIIGGVWGIISSFPFFSLYTSIKQGGITVNNKVSIQQVQPNTPASEAQLMKGDTIVSINGKNITSSSEFVDISRTNQGKEVSIVIERNGNPQTVQLVPRINPPTNEGRLGIVLTNTGVEKKSTLELISQVIIRSYLGKELIRLQSLFFGIISVAIGIGLWKWKKWAFYGYLLSAGYGVIASIPYLANPAHYNTTKQIQPLFFPIERTSNLTDTLIVIVSLIMGLLLAYYIFRQKKLFQ
ncbi:MAG: regulator of sigma E protease [Microgenomates group bacterium Gr01-1014_16]|nr:MAG: regulator of sigma E protease [Microgenomates group bacterium Gr01-1014_16]